MSGLKNKAFYTGVKYCTKKMRRRFKIVMRLLFVMSFFYLKNVPKTRVTQYNISKNQRS